MKHVSASNGDLMRIEIDPASAQAFMTASLKAGRNGIPLTLGSALVALDIDPWSLAGELAIAQRRDAVKRLEAVLSKVDGGLPGAAIIARQARSPPCLSRRLKEPISSPSCASPPGIANSRALSFALFRSPPWRSWSCCRSSVAICFSPLAAIALLASLGRLCRLGAAMTCGYTWRFPQAPSA